MRTVKTSAAISLLCVCVLGLYGCAKPQSGGDRKAFKTDCDCITIMPLGDSITAGYSTNDGGYRSRLQQLLFQAGYNFKFVGRKQDQSGEMKNPEHEGYSGFRIRQISTVADEAVELFQPDIILLFAGTNDIRDHLPYEIDNSVPESLDYWGTAPERLDEMITHLTSMHPGGVIVVGTLLPFTQRWASAETRALMFNQKLLELIDKHVRNGNNVYLADLREKVSSEDLVDGIHPNQVGYEKIAEVWFEALVPIIRDLRCP